LAYRAALALSGVLARPDETALGIELLADICACFAQRPADVEKFPTTSLIAALTADRERKWATFHQGREPIQPDELAHLLKPFGILPKQIRIGEANLRGYERAAFADSFARYLSASGPLQPLQTNKDAGITAETDPLHSPSVAAPDSS